MLTDSTLLFAELLVCACCSPHPLARLRDLEYKPARRKQRGLGSGRCLNPLLLLATALVLRLTLFQFLPRYGQNSPHNGIEPAELLLICFRPHYFYPHSSVNDFILLRATCFRWSATIFLLNSFTQLASRSLSR
jgi:hypothetical protein